MECCIVHQPHADVMDVVFSICNIVSTELPAEVVAASQILADHAVGTWGDLHPALREHEQHEFVKAMFTMKGLSGLNGLRKSYIVCACVSALHGRVAAKKEQLQLWVKQHSSVLAEMDGLCGVMGPETLSSGYGIAFTELLKKGSVTLAEITDEPKATQPGADKVQEKISFESAQGKTISGSDESECGRLISQWDMSKFDLAKQAEAKASDLNSGVGSLLTSSEAVHELQLYLAADMMMKARTVG